MAFFESLGVELKTERGNRVFPVSDKSSSIVGALGNAAKDAGVRFITDKALELLIMEDKRVKGVRCEKGSYFSDNVIVATGGKSYPKTGSTGRWI